MSTAAHVLVLLIVIGAIVFILGLLRQRRLRGKYALLWVGVGVLLFLFALFPDVLVPISDWVGIGYEPATFFLAAIAFLFLLVVHYSFELSRLEERTRTLAEELALLRARQDADEAERPPDPDAP